MSRVYMLTEDGLAQPLQRVKCTDEGKELQSLLELNPHLLPSEQISPDNPLEWLLIKREMPVIDPASGIERWSIDFLFIDNMAVPTLVECKRCNDTRSRREVVAQMLEYAANGHHYWSVEDLQAYAQESTGGLENLNLWVSRFYSASTNASDFFEAATANLRKATMRLIFFLEDSPPELRSLVEFLNGQMKNTEVLLVEARLYDSPSGRVVVPWLFGYTEEARVAKRESRAQVVREGAPRGEEAYVAAFEQGLLEEPIKAGIRHMLNAWSNKNRDISYWSFRASAIFMVPSMHRTRGLFQIGQNGDLQLYFNNWQPDARSNMGAPQIEFRDAFSSEIQKLFGIQFSDKQLRGFPIIKAAVWVGKVAELVSMLQNLLTSETST